MACYRAIDIMTPPPASSLVTVNMPVKGYYDSYLSDVRSESRPEIIHPVDASEAHEVKNANHFLFSIHRCSRYVSLALVASLSDFI